MNKLIVIWKIRNNFAVKETYHFDENVWINKYGAVNVKGFFILGPIWNTNFSENFEYLILNSQTYI